MIVTLGSRSTLTLPAELRKALALEAGDPIEITVKNGSLVLTPVAVVPRLWRLSPSGENKEAEADRQIAAGKLKRFDTAEQLIEDLNEDR